jgi:glycosyltransferase involved in cell wall biosynthesis
VIHADQRWIGNHGIGRFARHVLAGLEYRPVPLASHPAAALDSVRLARALRDLGNSDLFFSPGYNAPLFCRAPFIFTIHDLTHIHCPESIRRQVQLYYATVIKRACRRAARILTVSEFTRKEIIDWSGVPEEKVVNVGNGVETTYRVDGDSYELPFPYLLAVSNRKPHKNEFRIVEAFANADLDPRLHLAFTGQPTPELAGWIDKERVTARVQFLGAVREEKLPSLYRGAEALIFPSLYEGFGLPIVEAMACGTPVVTSNVTAMPETAGDAALLVDPRSVEEITEAVEQVIGDSSLRQQLKERGVKRASQLTRERTSCKVGQLLAALTPKPASWGDSPTWRL